jgi:putative endonuclease
MNVRISTTRSFSQLSYRQNLEDKKQRSEDDICRCFEQGSSFIVGTSFRRMPESRSTGKEACMERLPCVYLLASQRNGTLYTGVTSDLVKRVWEHKHHAVEGFTAKYGVHNLVWHEMHETMESAIKREKAIRNWKRAWKINVIEATNPHWRDLYNDLL